MTSQSKKFDFRVVQKRDSWMTEITRRVTSRKTHVSKRQSGFATEAEAKAWGESELKSFASDLNQRNVRDNKQRKDNEQKIIDDRANRYNKKQLEANDSNPDEDDSTP